MFVVIFLYSSNAKSGFKWYISDAHSLVLEEDTHRVHEVANCLKRFFRQLKDPLFTRAGYQDWINSAGNVLFVNLLI